MLYTIIKSPIFEPNIVSFLLRLATEQRTFISLEQNNLIEALTKYQNVYLTDSLEKAHEISESLYHEHRPPKASGSFGLILQVQVKMVDIPQKISFDPCEFYNEWVKQQRANYQQEHSDHQMEGYKISADQLVRIEAAIVPEIISVKYPVLQSKEFAPSHASKCIVM